MPATFLVLALAQVPIVTPPSADKAPILRVGEGQAPVVTRQVEVELYGGSQMLWRGQLLVGAGIGASYFQSLQQAPSEDCPALPPGRITNETSIRINLNLLNYGGASVGPLLNYSADWVRPGSCAGGPTRRSVTVSGQLPGARGQSQVVKGDGGLELRLNVR